LQQGRRGKEEEERWDGRELHCGELFLGLLVHTIFRSRKKTETRERWVGPLERRRQRADVFLVKPGVLVERRREEVHGTPSRVLAS